MKLSVLKELVKQLEAHSAPGSDPNVRFWMPRPEGLPAAEKDAKQFVEFDITAGSDIQHAVWESKIVAISDGCLPKLGDFDLPVHMVPFYK